MRRFIKNLITITVMGIPAWVILAAILHEEPTSLLVRLEEPGVRVELDDHMIKSLSSKVGPVDLEPGEHQLKVSKGEEVLYTRSLTLAHGEQKVIDARWTPEPAIPLENLDSAAAAGGSSVPPLVLRGVQDLTGHLDTVTGVGFQGENQAVSVGRDHTLRFWDLNLGRSGNAIQASSSEPKGLMVLDEGRRIVTLGDNGSIEIYDASTGLLLKRIDSGLSGAALCLAASRDSRLLALGSDAGAVRVVDLVSGESRSILDFAPTSTGSLAFSPDGKTLLVGLAAAPRLTNAILVYDLATDKVVRKLIGHTAPVWGLCFLPDGRQAVSVGGDRTLRLWDVTAGKERKQFPGQSGVGRCVAVSPDGRYAVTGSGYRWSFEGGWKEAPSYGVTVWDLVEGRVVGLHSTHGPVSCLALSSDGRRAIVGGANALLHAFDLPDGREVSSTVSTSVKSVPVPKRSLIVRPPSVAPEAS